MLGKHGRARPVAAVAGARGWRRCGCGCKHEPRVPKRVRCAKPGVPQVCQARCAPGVPTPALCRAGAPLLRSLSGAIRGLLPVPGHVEAAVFALLWQPLEALEGFLEVESGFAEQGWEKNEEKRSFGWWSSPQTDPRVSC